MAHRMEQNTLLARHGWKGVPQHAHALACLDREDIYRDLGETAKLIVVFQLCPTFSA